MAQLYVYVFIDACSHKRVSAPGLLLFNVQLSHPHARITRYLVSVDKVSELTRG